MDYSKLTLGELLSSKNKTIRRNAISILKEYQRTIGAIVSPTKDTKKRLEELRRELRKERISYGELAELQSLAKYIDPSDVELLEAAGVPEQEDDVCSKCGGTKDSYESICYDCQMKS